MLLRLWYFVSVLNLKFLDQLERRHCKDTHFFRPFYIGAPKGPFLWGLKKTILYSTLVLKNPYKKSAKQENSGLFMNSILCRTENRGENKTKTGVREDPILCPENSTKNAVQEFHLRIASYSYRGFSILPPGGRVGPKNQWQQKTVVLFSFFLFHAFTPGRRTITKISITVSEMLNADT